MTTVNRGLHRYTSNVTYSDDVLDRFWTKTAVDHDLWFEGTQCIIWIASAANRNGYGRFWDGSQFWVSHRFAYALEHGQVPEGLEVDHRCRRLKCVNHLHLEAVTPCENRRRAERHRLHQLTCPAGHLWTRENWQDQRCHGTLTRRCGQCNREKASTFYENRAIPPRQLADITPKCRAGHPRTESNTRFNKNGVVVCKDCQRERRREFNARQADCVRFPIA